MIALPPQPDLDLTSLVRTIPDFPKPGIQFRDITTPIVTPGSLPALRTGTTPRPIAVAIAAPNRKPRASTATTKSGR